MVPSTSENNSSRKITHYVNEIGKHHALFVLPERKNAGDRVLLRAISIFPSDSLWHQNGWLITLSHYETAHIVEMNHSFSILETGGKTLSKFSRSKTLAQRTWESSWWWNEKEILHYVGIHSSLKYCDLIEILRGGILRVPWKTRTSSAGGKYGKSQVCTCVWCGCSVRRCSGVFFASERKMISRLIFRRSHCLLSRTGENLLDRI